MSAGTSLEAPPSAGVHPEPGSFRDRDNRVFVDGQRILRALGPESAADWRAVTESGLIAQLEAAGSLVSSSELERDAWPNGVALPASEPEILLEHERIPFLTWPYEWTFGMLRDAAQLQLGILDEALQRGAILKDATPYNVQFRGPAPVFIDAGSFVPYEQGVPWIAYGQFCQLFLNPLLLQARTGVSFRAWMRGSQEGIPTVDLRSLIGWRHALRSGVLFDVILQARLIRRQQRREAKSGEAIVREMQASGFNEKMILRNVQRLQRVIEKTRWNPPATVWTSYADTKTYEAEENAAKSALVEKVAADVRPSLAWDLGCNDGMYSRIVAAHAGTVLALDQDEPTLESVRAGLIADGVHNVTPLVFDIANPSPAQGWRNAERGTLLDRGRPDLVLALALVHHLSISANAPLSEVVAWLRSLPSEQGRVIVEFPTRDDVMVQRLLQNKPDARHLDYDLPVFERELAAVFDIEHREELSSGTRVLFVARPR